MSSRPFNRTLRRQPPSSQADWYRIENKKKDGKTTTEIYIYDEIGFWGTNASDFVKELKDLETDQIDLHINSPGGEIFDGIAIYNAIKSHPATVTTYIDALAASAASFIAQAGDKVLITRNGTMMIHDGLAICIGNAADMHKTGDLLDKLSDNIADIYAANAGGKADEWRAQMREEVWFNSEEAVESGLAHEVLDYDDDEAEEAENKWDFSLFMFAGRDQAPSPASVRKHISNRVKETPVKPNKKNQSETPPEGTPGEGGNPEEEESTNPPEGGGGEGTTTPGTESTEGGEDTEGTGGQGGSEGGAPDAQSGQPTPTNRAGVVQFTVGGETVTDPKRVQAHINSLETFRRETLDQARKDFIAKLASDNKIMASQIKGLEEFVNGLSNEQYEAWKSTWDVAAPLPQLGSHGGGANNTGPQGAEADQQEEIKNLRDIVQQHKWGGMSKEKIENTASFKRLKELDPDYKL